MTYTKKEIKSLELSDEINLHKERKKEKRFGNKR
jgi:hypothetical protein